MTPDEQTISMKTVSCHRKYPITTNFLDTMLEHSVVIEDGESKLDAYRRGLKELDQIAADLRKEAESMRGQIIEETLQGAKRDFPPIGPATPQIIDYKKWEKFEIDIDNAETSEELEAIVRSTDTFPGRLLSTINAKRQALKPKNFVDGLE
jgi:hypothetical protein